KVCGIIMVQVSHPLRGEIIHLRDPKVMWDTLKNTYASKTFWEQDTNSSTIVVGVISDGAYKNNTPKLTRTRMARVRRRHPVTRSLTLTRLSCTAPAACFFGFLTPIPASCWCT